MLPRVQRHKPQHISCLSFFAGGSGLNFLISAIELALRSSKPLGQILVLVCEPALR